SVSYPEPYQRLYLRDVSVTECAAIDTRVPAGERYLLDRAVARETVREALTGLGIFKQVELVSMNDSRSLDDGLVLDLALDDSALVHTGERTAAGFWLWLFTGFPGLFVHDQQYTVFYDARARVSDARTRETLVAWESLAGPTGEGYALDFHERTTGFGPYVAVWIIPPTVLGIDEIEVARQVLPPSLRPTIQALVKIFNQVTFAPVNKFEVLVRPALGIRVDDVKAPVKGGLADVTIHATLAPDATISWAACGDVKVDFPAMKPSSLEKPIEIVLPGVPVVPGEKLDIEVGIAGQTKPQRLVTLTATQSGDLKAERATPPSAEAPASAPKKDEPSKDYPAPEQPAPETPATEKPASPVGSDEDSPIIIKGKKKN
ncbi:MAG: hypothetical protein ACAI25_08250, partial [Planctomycetota bacterium]